MPELRRPLVRRALELVKLEAWQAHRTRAERSPMTHADLARIVERAIERLDEELAAVERRTLQPPAPGLKFGFRFKLFGRTLFEGWR